MKAAAHTNHAMPSQRLIKQLCYPEAYKFSTVATRYMYNCYVIACSIMCTCVGGVVSMKRVHIPILPVRSMKV